MKIITAQPPNIEILKSKFDITEGVIFAFGDTIYSPSGDPLPNFLIAHEEIHGFRQGSDPYAWWDRYIQDIEFRYHEELLAHAREFQVRSVGIKDRNEITRLLMWSANRLAAPLYGKLATTKKATQDIQNVIKSHGSQLRSAPHEIQTLHR